jgi:hypothetical protein
VGPIEDEHGNLIENDNLKTANTLNNQFAKQFTKEDLSNIPQTHQKFTGSATEKLSSAQFNVVNLKKKLKSLNTSKSPGGDDIFPIVLNTCAEVLSGPLCTLFRKSMESGDIPADWRDANVIPIFKKGQKCKPGNYRPVSLTSQVCKLMEFFILEHITGHLKQHNLINDTQHGFRTKRSCLSNLLLFLEEVTRYVDQGYPVDVIYLDFSKAFDTVPHQRLLSKLHAHGISGKVNRWIEQWLTGRRQRVCISGELSEWKDVTSGVPQGSILGPALFTIFINDIDCNIVSILSKFADDTKALRHVPSTEFAFTLQEDLHTMYKWSQDWQLLFNKDKCKCIHIGHNNMQYDYFIGEDLIQTTDVEKDLGVHIHKSLKAGHHVNFIVNKANRQLGCIRRTYSDKSLSNIKQLYISLVRPILETCQQVWCPYLQCDINKIESVQRRATRMIASIRKLPYTERLKRCGLIPLCKRRLRSDLIETYKIMHGFTDIPIDALFELNSNPRPGHHNFTIILKYSRLDVRQKFYSQRVIQHWNKLPERAVNATSINAFKGQLAKFL